MSWFHQADRVLVGSISAVEQTAQEEVATIAVEELLKGEAGGAVRVRRSPSIGGTCRGPLPEGSRWLLFLHAQTDGETAWPSACSGQMIIGDRRHSDPWIEAATLDTVRRLAASDGQVDGEAWMATAPREFGCSLYLPIDGAAAWGRLSFFSEGGGEAVSLRVQYSPLETRNLRPRDRRDLQLRLDGEEFSLSPVPEGQAWAQYEAAGTLPERVLAHLGTSPPEILELGLDGGHPRRLSTYRLQEAFEEFAECRERSRSGLVGEGPAT